MSSALSILFGILMFLLAGFLILLILVQRGRGGGLTGALGGMGGQSAFGTKAGDLFTRVTMVTAAVWILLSIAVILVMNPQSHPGAGASDESVGSGARDYTPSSGGAATPSSPSGTSGAQPAGGPSGAPAPTGGATP